MEKIRAWTDGSCYWKIRKGGWGAYIECDDSSFELSGGYNDTTISRMEIRAVLEVLKWLPYEKCALIVYSDSEYVVKSFVEGRLWRWLEKDFIGVKNDDLWKEVVELLCVKDVDLNIEHVRGHQKLDSEHGIKNAIADALAQYDSHEVYIDDK